MTSKDPLDSFYGKFLTDKGIRKGKSKDGERQSSSAAAGEAVHSLVQAEYAMRGNLAAAELPIVDAPNQMVSKLDILTHQGEAIEIKTVSLSEIVILREPRPEHKMQLIYYLNALNTGESDLEGIILYVAREAPGIRKAFKIDKDGEATHLEGAAIRYMQLRRGGISPEKFTSSLTHAISEYKSPQSFARDFKTIASEAKKFRMRNLNNQKKKHSSKHFRLRGMH